MYQRALPDEHFCLMCLKDLADEKDLYSLLVEEDLVCASCRSIFKEHKKIYSIDGVDVHVLYEYTEELESLFFQYKEQRDIVLAPVFLYPYRQRIRRILRRYVVCGMCSSDEKYMERVFVPLEEIFHSIGVDLYFPLYKTKNIKQSAQDKMHRKQIRNYVSMKTCYPLKGGEICLVDDVCTTGASLQVAIDFLKPKVVFLLSANPLWIEANKQYERVEKNGLFW